MPFGFGDEKVGNHLILDEPLHLTNEQKLGMIRSILSTKMDTQQLNSAMKEIRDILEN